MVVETDALALTQELFSQRTGMPWRCVQLLGFVGSISHGTHMPSADPDSIDDVDMMGIVIPPPERMIGGIATKEWTHEVIKEGVIDAVFYSLEKAIGLLTKGNPNIVGLLWMKDGSYPVRTDIGERLIANRPLFSTLYCYESFVHYARDQFDRMEAFDIDRMTEYETLTARMKAVWPHHDVLRGDPPSGAYADAEIMSDVQRLRWLHKKYFSGYMGEKRKKLVRTFGYDCRNASHLIRLLRMCCDFLLTGAMQVDRTDTDADELRAIKTGQWSLNMVRAEATRLFALAELYRERSRLRAEAPLDTIAAMTAGMHLRFWQTFYDAQRAES